MSHNATPKTSRVELRKTLTLIPVVMMGLAYMQPMTLFDTFGIVSGLTDGHVATAYAFEYTFEELVGRRIEAPAHIIKAAGDDYSFIEGASGYSATPPTVTGLDADHYQVLRQSGVQELVAAIRELTACQ